jgi:hypothetical protein
MPMQTFLYHAVTERLVNLSDRRSRAAVKDKMEAYSLAVRLNDGVLAFFQHAGLQAPAGTLFEFRLTRPVSL